MMSGKDFLKSHVLSWRRKVYSDWEDVTSSGRAFQVFGPATGKALLPMVDHLTDGARRRLVPVAWSDRLPGRLLTGTSGPRYGGALPWRTLNVSRAILYSIRSAMCNQWRVANASVIWSADRTWKITRAAAFRTNWVAVQGMLVGQPVRKQMIQHSMNQTAASKRSPSNQHSPGARYIMKFSYI